MRERERERKRERERERECLRLLPGEKGEGVCGESVPPCMYPDLQSFSIANIHSQLCVYSEMNIVKVQNP